MRYNKIRKMDIANGPGVRVSIFMQGCTFKCPECFNPETHDFNGGQEFDATVIARVLQLGAPEFIQGLSILGGEPLHPNNLAGTTQLAKAFKQQYPQKTIWCWTGFQYDDIKGQEVLQYLDVLVDGRFQKQLADPMLKFRGSANQRLIDVPKTLAQQQIVLWQE